MTNRRTLNSLILAAALLIGAGPYVVNAARTAADPNTRANIDLRQVYDESEASQTADAKTALFGRKLDQKFAELVNMPYLTPAEYVELSMLLVKDAPTPEETKKTGELKAEGEKRAGELTALSAKKDADLTPADRNRMRELNGMRSTHQQSLARVQALYQRMVNEENAKHERAGVAEVRALVAKLAKDKGIAEVYDSSTMIVAPVDLTKEAVERAKKKP